MNHSEWIWLPVAVIAAPAAHAATYLTTDQALQTIFPGEAMTAVSVTLSDEQAKQIEEMAGVKVSSKHIAAWKATHGGWVVFDKVIGKHELINYAVGVNPDGSIKQIEILDYRESYGYEVRSAAWRGQFVGKKSSTSLNQDIRNISGATLSCRHVTDGVKRVLATYVTALK